ncbi:MAG: hypothetical protein AB1352_04280 [Patescibacteria group bacterium]
MLTDPFKLFGRLIVASIQITGYVVTFVIQFVLYSARGQRDKVVDAIGYLGRSVSDAVGNALRK